MPVSFERIPSTIKVPLFYAEVTNQLAGFFAQEQPAALIGPKLATSTAPANVPQRVSNFAEAADKFGNGSVLADMVATYRMNDTFGEIWCIPVDQSGAVPAVGTLAFGGTATEAGMISIYIGGDLARITVPRGATGQTVAEAAMTAINSIVGGLVLATMTGAPTTVTLTARQQGALGNEVAILADVLMPAGITLSSTGMASGAGIPSIVPAMQALGDETYDFIGLAWSDVPSLNAAQDALSDITGRWAWDRQSYGHAFAARMGLANDLANYGRARNDQHMTLIGYPQSPTPPWRVMAAWLAQAAVSLRIDPARPLQTLPLVNVIGPERVNTFSRSQLQTLLTSGIAPANPTPPLNDMQIIRSITTYQRNRWGQPDPSYLDIQTMFTLMYFIRFLRSRILQKFPRHKLANDGTVFGPGQAIVTPRIIRAELLAAYDELQRTGIVEDVESFDQLLIVERDPNDPNRVNVMASPDLVNQLRILAMLVAFRLQATTGVGGGVTPLMGGVQVAAQVSPQAVAQLAQQAAAAAGAPPPPAQEA